jgi:hypothetical protein
MVHHLVVKLSESCGILPPALNITGVRNCSKASVAGGGFADIFRGSYRGKDVALKRLRYFDDQECGKIHKVRHLWNALVKYSRLSLVYRSFVKKLFFGKVLSTLMFCLSMGLIWRHSCQECAWYHPGCNAVRS